MVAVMLPAIVIEIPLAMLDAGRIGWSDVPLWVVLIGYVLLIGGIAVTTWAQAVNPFFSKHRQQSHGWLRGVRAGDDERQVAHLGSSSSAGFFLRPVATRR